MSAPKHTAGPWHLVSERRSQGNGKRGYPNSDTGPQLLICGPAGATVITRRGLAKPSKPEGQANARLIAAAPCGLAAAVSAEASLTEIERDHPEWMRPCDLAALSALRAFIKKATGADQ